jgi:hypothetical protein
MNPKIKMAAFSLNPPFVNSSQMANNQLLKLLLTSIACQNKYSATSANLNLREP